MTPREDIPSIPPKSFAMRSPEPKLRWGLEFLVAALAATGFGLIYRLAQQAARGFDAGCGGFDPNALSEEPSGCATAFSSEYVAFLGIENTTLGMLFYGSVLLFSVGLWFAYKRYAVIRLLRMAFVGVSSLYAWYLVYILFSGKAGAICELCLTSHGITTAIFFILLTDFFLNHRYVHSTQA